MTPHDNGNIFFLSHYDSRLQQQTLVQHSLRYLQFITPTAKYYQNCGRTFPPVSQRKTRGVVDDPLEIDNTSQITKWQNDAEVRSFYFATKSMVAGLGWQSVCVDLPTLRDIRVGNVWLTSLQWPYSRSHQDRQGCGRQTDPHPGIVYPRLRTPRPLAGE